MFQLRLPLVSFNEYWTVNASEIIVFFFLFFSVMWRMSFTVVALVAAVASHPQYGPAQEEQSVGVGKDDYWWHREGVFTNIVSLRYDVMHAAYNKSEPLLSDYSLEF